jgi:excisionase family DNA binding protein
MSHPPPHHQLSAAAPALPRAGAPPSKSARTADSKSSLRRSVSADSSKHAGSRVSQEITLTLPPALLDALAERVADLLRAGQTARHEVVSPWLDVEHACAYTGLSKDALYKLTAARAIPFRKKAGGQGLRFHRDELDAWMESQYPRLDRLG